jgi:CheY-like chemotaxis protein
MLNEQFSFKVLVVDDEPAARRGVRRLLSGEADFVVVGECGAGIEAVAAIRDLEPDLVFLDVQMPEMDGFGVVEAVGIERFPALIFVTGYDPLTGKELWRFADSKTEVKQQVPIFASGMIIVAGGYPPGRPIYAFRPGGRGDISLKEGEETNQFIAWRIPKGSAYTPAPLAYNGHLYICDDKGVMRAWRISTGELIYEERLPSSFSASPVAGDGKLYLASEDGELFVVKTGAKFELLATNPMGESLMATPAISDGKLIVRGRHHVFAIAENRP